jgi:hypothetical protein
MKFCTKCGCPRNDAAAACPRCNGNQPEPKPKRRISGWAILIAAVLGFNWSMSRGGEHPQTTANISPTTRGQLCQSVGEFAKRVTKLRNEGLPEAKTMEPAQG